MPQPEQPTPDLLRRLVRTTAKAWLADPNVSSVGIGHKVVDGRRTDTVSVQFTVHTKAEPEALVGLGTALLPESVTFESVEVPTDVLQASFRPSFRVVAETAAEERAVGRDPVPPGVSVAHPTVSAGTLGCFVRDREDATVYALSNWHVLHGPQGRIGDAVLQPGPHDDNRASGTRMGRLVRSHLGVAGDCAVATVEGRGVDPEVLGLGVVPDSMADPELGDRVVKSGRTTAVTHGVVSRVDVVVKINYGQPVGEVQVGCLEIEPDPHRRGTDGQLSDGGDSGAVWLHKARNGRPTGVLAGLHFGGNDVDTGERALACLPRSVFEKLGVTLDAGAAIERAGAAVRSRGYAADFLPGHDVPVPAYDDESDLVEVDGSTTIPYTHFSLAQSRSRRFARWVAWNIDGGSLRRLSRSGQKFRLDPRLPKAAQVGEELYADNRIDRGHIARRADLTWGPQAGQANADSFFFTNIAPQVDDFNQSGKDGVWGNLENAVYADVEVDDLRVSVFGGPVFAEDDRSYRGVQLPREFWKLITFVADGQLRARPFLLSQDLDRLESLDLDEFRTWQVDLATLTERTMINFPGVLTDGATTEATAGPRRLDSTADIAW